MQENRNFLTEQIITYLGNKRGLYRHVEEEIIRIQKELGKSKTRNVDLFSGSGIIARMMKKYSSTLIVNDLEDYSRIINECYLTNIEDFNLSTYNEHKNELLDRMNNGFEAGIITENYSPQDDTNIKHGERVFYTNENAIYIDTARKYIETIDEESRSHFLAPLLYEASVKTNTGGVFKGFYKDKETGIGQFGGTGEFALQRIKGKIEIEKPVLSNFSCEVIIEQEDSNELVKNLRNLDIVYIDPPYNQHPYGSNYFMLNVIANNELPKEISKVSGIPKNWNRSKYNVKKDALTALSNLVKNIDSKYLIISYNSEGFISYKEMVKMLKGFGSLEIREIPYNTYRASRNLSERNLYVEEYLFILKK